MLMLILAIEKFLFLSFGRKENEGANLFTLHGIVLNFLHTRGKKPIKKTMLRSAFYFTKMIEFLIKHGGNQFMHFFMLLFFLNLWVSMYTLPHFHSLLNLCVTSLLFTSLSFLLFSIFVRNSEADF